MTAGALSGWRWEYAGDSKARISGEHPHKPGMRYTHTIIEDWTPARTKHMAAVMCAAPELLAALESCHEAARLMCDPEHCLAEYMVME